jgi:methyl-accepting chemotaxis protein
MSKLPVKRRNVFINKAFQWRFIAGVFLLILLSGLCSALLIFWITGGDLQAQSQTAHANIINAWDRLGLSIFIGNVVAIFIAGTLAVFVALYASHKIAGPLYRFEKLCEQVGDGDLDVLVTLREKDQLQELGLAFAGMIKKLRARQSEQQEVVNKINAQIEQLKNDQNITGHQLGELNELARLIHQL